MLVLFMLMWVVLCIVFMVGKFFWLFCLNSLFVVVKMWLCVFLFSFMLVLVIGKNNNIFIYFISVRV